MAQTAKAVVVEGQAFTVQEFEVPDPEPGAVLVKQELAGICGTDLHFWQHGFDRKLILGHENVGIVAALGQGVTHDSLGRPVKEGDRVVLQPGIPTGWGYGFKSPPYLYGGFADYMYLDLPGTCWWRTDMSPEVGVLTEPFTIGVHAVDRAHMHIGDTVVVQGSGAYWSGHLDRRPHFRRRENHSGGRTRGPAGTGAQVRCGCMHQHRGSHFCRRAHGTGDG